MDKQPVSGRAAPRWGWWLLAAFLGAAVVIDAIDGQPLKLATSVLLFVSCLLSALVRPPRRGLVSALIVVCTGAAVLLIVYRLLMPGL